jgi:2-oxoglutarate ferredoxin oxidoreductase subunit alpha
MVEKRLRKKLALMKDIEEPIYFGVDDPKVVFIGWGSTYGVIREAISNLLKEGYEIGHLHFSDVYPLPTKTLNNLKDKKLYTIEGNYEGQLASLIRKEACVKVEKGIVKYNGMPFFVEEIMKGVKEIMG